MRREALKTKNNQVPGHRRDSAVRVLARLAPRVAGPLVVVLLGVLVVGCSSGSVLEEAKTPQTQQPVVNPNIPSLSGEKLGQPTQQTGSPSASAGAGKFPTSWQPAENPDTEEEKILNAWARYWRVVIENSNQPLEIAQPALEVVAKGEMLEGDLNMIKKSNDGQGHMEGSIAHHPHVEKVVGNRASVNDCQDNSKLFAVKKSGERFKYSPEIAFGVLEKGEDNTWKVILKGRNETERCPQ